MTSSRSPGASLRITFLIRSLGLGGAEQQLALLAAGMHEQGHDVVVAVNYDGGAHAGRLAAAGVPIESFGKRSRWDLLRPGVRLWRLLRRRRDGIVHGYMPTANLLASLLGRLAGVRTVVWGIRSSDMRLEHYGIVSRLAARVATWASWTPDLIIANSEAGRLVHLAAGFPGTNFIVIPNGIDLERFQPDPVARAHIRAAWGVPSSAPVVGVVARIDPMKDHRNFLQAVALARREIPDLHAIIAGDGSPALRNSLLQEAERLGLMDRTLWLRPGQDVVPVYHGLDLLVSSSKFGEGFSNAIGEAMACNVAVVATDVGDSRAILAAADRVVRPEDPPALAAAILMALRAPRGTPRARIQAEYSVPLLVQRTIAALTSR